MTLSYTTKQNENSRILEATCDKTEAVVIVTTFSRMVQISVYCSRNGSRSRFGKHFSTWGEAFGYYASPQMRAILTLASELSA